MTETVTLSAKNQVVIPRRARKALHLEAGHKLLVLARGDHLVMVPRPVDFVKKLSGLHQELWADVDTQVLLNEERNDWED